MPKILNASGAQTESPVVIPTDGGVGHNEIAVRLGLLANDAKIALERVAKGEGDAIEGWIAYGAALNEGRKLFHLEDDKGFGQWVEENLLCQLATVEVDRHERAAAMWAAANPSEFAEARAAGGARTVRGIYAKWNEINAERAAAAAHAAAEKARQEAAEKAAVEAEARRKEQEARDEEARKAAAEAVAQAEKATAAAEKTAKTAGKTAKKAQKKADKVKAGNTSADNVRGTTGTGENEWYTPEEHIELAKSVMGGIDLDPASSELANEKVGATKFFTKEDSGLDKKWNGRIWLNPPYSQPAITWFAEKMIAEWNAGNVEEAIMLTHNYTDTAWFQDLARASTMMCFTRGRVKFVSPDGDVASPTQGQAFFYFGRKRLEFVKVFSEIGFVVSTVNTA